MGCVAGAWGWSGPVAHLQVPPGLEGPCSQHHCLEGHQWEGLCLARCPRRRAPAGIVPPHLGLWSWSSSKELATKVRPLLPLGPGLCLYGARGVQYHALIFLDFLPLLFCEGFHVGTPCWDDGDELTLSVSVRLSYIQSLEILVTADRLIRGQCPRKKNVC